MNDLYNVNVTAIIEVDTLVDNSEVNIKEYVENLITPAPKIRGKRYNARYFVNIPPGHSVLVKDKNGTITKFFQSHALITVFGTVEETTEEKVKKEYKEFLSYLREKCFLKIISEVVSIK